MSVVVYIGVGANLGDRAASVLGAFEHIDEIDSTAVRRVSTLVRSAAVDVLDQPEFVNAVVEVDTELEPADLLAALLSVERGMGRCREGTVPRGPRPIDLDILLWSDRVVDGKGLTIPHPRMHERAFVLLGLVELAPDLQHPVLGRDMSTLLALEIAMHGPVEYRVGILRPGLLEGISPRCT